MCRNVHSGRAAEISPQLAGSAGARPRREFLEKGLRRGVDYMADVRISIGCFSSHRLKMLKAIMATSMGN